MTYTIEYRTHGIEYTEKDGPSLVHTVGQESVYREFWYEGDNEPNYASIEDAYANSDVIRDWRRGPCDLTAVRIRNDDTNACIYVSPHE